MSWICSKCETENPESAIECEVCSSISPSINSISYSDVDITKQTNIAWSASDCDKIELIFEGKEYNVSGKTEFDLFIKKNSEITFRVSNDVTTRVFSYLIHIKPPQIIYFNVDKISAYKKEEILLQWKALNCTNIKIEGIGEFDPIGEKKIIAANNKYKIIAENSSGKVSKEIKLNLFKKPEIELKLSKTKLRKGTDENSQIKWNIKHYSSAKLLFEDKEMKIESSSGSQIVKPVERTNYILQIVGLDKKTIFTKEVSLDVLPDSIIEFTSDKQYSYHKVPITLSWNIKHAKKAELNGKEVDFESLKIVTIDKDTTYTLKVQDEFGVKEKSITVRMLPLPVIKSILIPTPKIENTINIHQYIPRQNVDVRIEIPHIEIPEYEPLHVEFNKEDVELRNNTIKWNELMEMEKLNTKLHDSSFSHIFGNVYNKLNSKIKQLWKK